MCWRGAPAEVKGRTGGGGVVGEDRPNGVGARGFNWQIRGLGVVGPMVLDREASWRSAGGSWFRGKVDGGYGFQSVVVDGGSGRGSSVDLSLFVTVARFLVNQQWCGSPT